MPLNYIPTDLPAPVIWSPSVDSFHYLPRYLSRYTNLNTYALHPKSLKSPWKDRVLYSLGSKFTATTRLTGLVWWMAKLESIPCQLSVCAAEGPKTLASIVDTTQDNVVPENTWISRWKLRFLAVPPPWRDSRWHRKRATSSVELLARSWSISFRKAQVMAFLTVLRKLAN